MAESNGLLAKTGVKEKKVRKMDTEKLLAHAEDPQTPPARLCELAKSSDLKIQLTVLRHPRCPPSVFQELKTKLKRASSLDGYRIYHAS